METKPGLAVGDPLGDALRVGDVKGLKGYEVREYMVVMRGRKLGGPRTSGRTAAPTKKR